MTKKWEDALDDFLNKHTEEELEHFSAFGILFAACEEAGINPEDVLFGDE